MLFSVIFHSPTHLIFFSGYFDQIISLFSQAMITAIETSHPQCKLLQDLLTTLSKMEKRTHHLTMMAYKWCSVICKKYSTLTDGKGLLFLSLEIGFHHLSPQEKLLKLVHTKYHHNMAKIVFESGNSEVIADLLHAWTSQSLFDEPYPLLTVCARYLAIPHYLEPFPPRLQRLAIRCIELIGHQGFKDVGVGRFVGLLDDLHVAEKDMDSSVKWVEIFLDIIQTPGGIQQLSDKYWELLINLIVSTSQAIPGRPYAPHIIPFLKGKKEWNKLKCWIGIVCILWPPENDKTVEEELEQVMVSLFHQQPSTIQEFGQWVEQYIGRSLPSHTAYTALQTQPQSFQYIYQRACSKAAQEVV